MPLADLAEKLDGAPRGLRRGDRVGRRQDIRHVQQRTAQQHAVSGLVGEAGGFAEVGHRLDGTVRRVQVDRAADEQSGQLVGAAVESLAESERLGSEPVGLRRAQEDLDQCELLQSFHRVGVHV